MKAGALDKRLNKTAAVKPQLSSQNTACTTILIADDHPVVREGLITAIKRQSDMRLVAEARNGLEAVGPNRIVETAQYGPYLEVLSAVHSILLTPRSWS
jgi:hypothetical protein